MTDLICSKCGMAHPDLDVDRGWDRLLELDAKITRVKQWGALLTALNEERQALLRSLEEEQR
jgi:hypothetical protein